MTKEQSISCLQKSGNKLTKSIFTYQIIQKQLQTWEESNSKSTQPSTFHLSTLLCIFCILGGLAVDYFLLRAVIEYLASLSSLNLAYLAVWIIPILIVGAEVWIAVEIVKTKRKMAAEKEALPSFKRHESIWSRLSNHPMLKWRLLSLLILAIQPASALATYYVLEKLNPDIHFSNVCLCVFSLILALAFHTAILNSGEQLLILEEDIKGFFRNRRSSGLTKDSMRAKQKVVICYHEYNVMLKEYQQGNEGDISHLELPSAVQHEANMICLKQSAEELDAPCRIELPELKVNQPEDKFPADDSPYPQANSDSQCPDSWKKQKGNA